MIETDIGGAPFEVRNLDAGWLLDVLGEAEELSRISDRRKLRLAAQWCVIHEVTDVGEAAAWGDLDRTGCLDGDETFGGAGTPHVARFSAEPFGAGLGISTVSAMSLLADALDLVHRLPLIHTQVEALRAPVWKARKVAAWTRSLSVEAAAFVDAELAPVLSRRGLVTIERVVAAAIARFHPELLAERERDGKTGWHVRVDHPSPAEANGTSWLDASADSVDLGRFADVVGEIAERLGIAGDPDTLDQRRAKALGLLADVHAGADLDALVAHAADLARAAAGGQDSAGRDSAGQDSAGRDVAAGDEVRSSDADASASSARPSPAGRAGRAGRAPRRREAVLHVHVAREDVMGATGGLADSAAGSGTDLVAQVERLGPATLAKVREWLCGSSVRIRPVLDLSETTWAVDTHDPPAAMADLVRLRDRTCVFPWCDRDSRGCDLDHIDAYVPLEQGGETGQTHPGNLAPLCRRHHRCKTSGRWRYRRGRDGTYHWTGPQHRTFTVTPGPTGGTTETTQVPGQ